MKSIVVSLIITHWNTPNDLRRLLKNLTPSTKAQIIVIDNDSHPHTTWLKNKFKKIVYIQNDQNAGFAKANNQGAQKAEGQWLLFLNPDVVLTDETLSQFIKSAEQKSYDACSPTSVEAYDKPLPSPLSLLIEFSPLRRFISLSLFKKRTLLGGCLLIKRDVFKKLGGWDETFFLWFEDSDLTKRLIDQGYHVGRVKNTGIFHAGGISIRKLPKSQQKQIFFSSMQLYAKRHFSRFGQLVIRGLCILNK